MGKEEHERSRQEVKPTPRGLVLLFIAVAAWVLLVCLIWFAPLLLSLIAQLGIAPFVTPLHW